SPYFISLHTRRTMISTLFPYTTLFRSLLERIEFMGGSPFQIVDTEQAAFAQDHFKVLPNLTLDGGARFERQSKASTLRFAPRIGDRKSTRLNSSHRTISYAVFCLKKKI